jgi:kynurenine formamidase
MSDDGGADMPGANPNDAYDGWLLELVDRPRFAPGDRIGTANHIDAAARLRAAAAILTGECIPLGRPVIEGDGAEALVTVDVNLVQVPDFNGRPWGSGGMPLDAAGDVTHVSAHGRTNTHLDALNHMGRGGHWYSGFAVDDPAGPSLAPLAGHGLFTRGVLVDVPAVRGTDWVDSREPVTGDDIDAALAARGTVFEPGDALLLYMGRDRYEAAGREMQIGSGEPTPGAGPGAARWIVEHEASILCWDFLDAMWPEGPDFPVHLLIWAIGLVLVDNAHLAGAAEQVRRTGRAAGAFVVTPPAIPRATGALVQPLFVQ